jgi:hypothetical protein
VSHATVSTISFPTHTISVYVDPPQDGPWTPGELSSLTGRRVSIDARDANDEVRSIYATLIEAHLLDTGAAMLRLHTEEPVFGPAEG